MFSRSLILAVPVIAVLALLSSPVWSSQQAADKITAPAEDKAAAPAANEAHSSALAPLPSDNPGEPDEPPSESRTEKPGSPGDLGASVPAPHAHAEETYAPATYARSIKPSPRIEKGKQTNFSLTLKNGSEVLTEDKLTLRHTKKIHLTLVDQSLRDFQHLHPVSNKDGGFDVSFRPSTSNNYMLWADVKRGTDAPQLLTMPLRGAEPCKENCVVKAATDKATFDGNTATIKLDTLPAKVGQPLDVDLLITDSEGKPFGALEPVMGAYGHAFAIYEDMTSMQHAHPRGAAPAAETDRGAAPLSFSFKPMKKGFYKIFIQLKTGGKDVLLPFGVHVE
ncbi:MAG: hypothetical protein ACAH80_00985 [Alphaproteobacteria bacterium]